jgi:hypothetical protein
MNKYGPKAQKKIAKNLHEHKHDGKFQSRDQAIAAALNQTRKAGGKAPDNPNE